MPFGFNQLMFDSQSFSYRRSIKTSELFSALIVVVVVLLVVFVTRAVSWIHKPTRKKRSFLIFFIVFLLVVFCFFLVCFEKVFFNTISVTSSFFNILYNTTTPIPSFCLKRKSSPAVAFSTFVIVFVIALPPSSSSNVDDVVIVLLLVWYSFNTVRLLWFFVCSFLISEFVWICVLFRSFNVCWVFDIYSSSSCTYLYRRRRITIVYVAAFLCFGLTFSRHNIVVCLFIIIIITIVRGRRQLSQFLADLRAEFHKHF